MEFGREAIKLALLGDKPQRKLAKDLGTSDVTLRNWIKQVRVGRSECARREPHQLPCFHDWSAGRRLTGR